MASIATVVHDLTRWARLADIGAKHWLDVGMRHYRAARDAGKPAPVDVPAPVVSPEAAVEIRQRISDDCQVLAAAGDVDALRVIAHIAARAVMGGQQYGPLKLATDHRDWRQEAREEAADGLFYLACLALERLPPRPENDDAAKR